MAAPAFNALPSELLLHILSYLDIPDLLALTRTSHTLRSLSHDPLLHIARLHRASLAIQHSLPLRPSLAELMAHRIYITRTTLAARSLGRNLISIKLNRRLLRRPSAEELVGRGVLPRECVVRGMAPGLVATTRRVERERVKDTLRSWVGEWRRRGAETCEGAAETEGQQINVRRMARMFMREGREGREGRDGRDGRDGRERETRWGERRRREREREDPARAHVLALRRFWERVGREGAGEAGRTGRGVDSSVRYPEC
ncbi:hypothetical protein B2J93_2112 [Marssonina coronariae]|uniref:F-box domain-containing protein n=1 Tax=Diplocarpon coronariae TaxID=2795749 RepID=A0A218Z2W7_9HELO|nr:hypothetical protein B2J93_2112 [Marssonina coronariae]